jgi:serine/threonine protein kinase
MTRAGDHLGAYELLRPLGAGGMAETFVATRRGPAGFEQRVCLKRILPGCAADPLFVELFLDEARLLARLQCANIVHVHDFGEVDGTYYMALELIDGVDLEGLLSALRARGERMPEQVALYVVSELLSALSYAHTLEIDGEEQHIVHRDISPSNVLLSKTGEVKLTDFGIAKARGRTHRTQAGHTKGKIAYMSPEQMRAEELDGRSDLFAVGVVLFELLTATHPFDADTDFALQLNIMQGTRKPLRELLPGASDALARLVDSLLATDKDQRPASASDAMELIPPLDNNHTLQKTLASLVKHRAVAGSGAAITGSGPSARVSAPASGLSARPASATPSAHPVVGARSTTVGGETKRSLKPALWLGLVALVLALGYMFGRRGDVASHTPSLPQTPAVGAGLPPPIPDAPTPTAPRAPEPATPPPRGMTAPSTDAPVTATVDHEDTAARHARRNKKRAERVEQTARGEHTRDDGAEDSRQPAEATAKVVESEKPAPAPSAPPLSQGAAPRNPESKPATPRTPYVTPSGRVVIPAPPL